MDLDDVFRDEISRTAEKSEDELAKFSIDPNLSPLDRNLKLLNGNDIQKSVACRSLVFLMEQIPQNEMTQILNGVKVALEASKDNHQVMFDMSEMICALLESKKHADQIKIIADIIFDGIDSVRGQYWGKALSIYIQMAPIAEVKNKIVALKSRSIISSSEAGRTAIAMSLGSLMLKIEKTAEQNEILQLSKELSNDVCLDVRRASSSQMDKIIKSLNQNQIPEIIAEFGFLICEEEEETVVETAIGVLPQVVSNCSEKMCFTEIIPLLTNILETDFINQTPSVSRALSSVLGPLCHTISQNPEEYSSLIRPIISAFIGFVSSTCEHTASAALDAIEPITELKTFDRNSNQNLITGPLNETMSEAIDQAFRRKESKIKIHIARNFIAGSSLIQKKLAQRLYIDLWKSLEITDTQNDIPVMEVLSEQSIYMSAQYARASDSSPLIADLSLDETSEVISHYHRADRSSAGHLLCGQSAARPSQSLEAIEPKFTFNQSASSELANYFNSRILDSLDIIHWRVVYFLLQAALRLNLPLSPLVQTSKKLIKESSYKPIRFLSSKLLACQMRLASVTEHKDIFKFLTDLITSPSCRDRECFIKLIPTLVRIYSKKFFKRHFYDSVLYLSKDKVPNIRYQICSILPQIKPMLTLPDDREKLRSLDETLRNIISYESDRDVRKIMEDVIITMDRIPVRMQRVSTAVDEDEKRKEEHEKQYEEAEKKKDNRLNRRNSSNSSLGSRDENSTTGGQSSDKWSTARSSLKSQSSGRRTAASKKRNTAK